MASDTISQRGVFLYDRIAQSHELTLGQGRVHKASHPDIQSLQVQTGDSLELQPLQDLDTFDGAASSGVHASSELSSAENKVDPLPSEPDSRWNRWTDLANKWWFFEILASVLSLGCFFALVVVLVVSDGKEQQRWLSDRLSLNGLVALLTTFTRASMMVSVAAALAQLKWVCFHPPSNGNHRPTELQYLDTLDQASRGPYGSAKLIFSSSWL